MDSDLFIVLMFSTIMLLFRKHNRVIFLLITLETFSMLTLFLFLINSCFISHFNSMGSLAALSCLVIEASMGLSLLVTLIRWQDKSRILNE